MLKVTDKKNGKVPEGYQLTSIGIIPLDWDLKPLGMIADEITQTAGTAMYETVSISAGIGFVNQAKKFGKELSGKQYEKYIVLHKGDFSYNKGNSQKYPQGCIYRLADRETAAVPNVFESFRIKDGVADYFEQLFISGFLNRQLFAKINHGVRDNGLLNLTGEDFYSCKVPFPPVKEQKKIAEILIQYDKIINLCTCKLEKVIKLKKACMDKMFPEQEKIIPEIRFPGFSDPWEHRKIFDIAVITAGGTPSTSNAEYWEPKEIPWLSSGEVHKKYVTETDDMISKEGLKNSSAKWIEEGSVLIALAGQGKTRGTAAIARIPMTTNQSIAAIKFDETVYPDYAFQNLDSRYDELRNISSGDGTRGGLNKQLLSDLEMMLPEYDEQKKIGDCFRSLDHLITLHQRELDEMAKMKKALMQQLLTGKVRVKIWQNL